MAEGGADDITGNIRRSANDRAGDADRGGGDIIGDTAGQAEAQSDDGRSDDGGAHGWSPLTDADIVRQLVK